MSWVNELLSQDNYPAPQADQDSKRAFIAKVVTQSMMMIRLSRMDYFIFNRGTEEQGSHRCAEFRHDMSRTGQHIICCYSVKHVYSHSTNTFARVNKFYLNDLRLDVDFSLPPRPGFLLATLSPMVDCTSFRCQLHAK